MREAVVAVAATAAEDDGDDDAWTPAEIAAVDGDDDGGGRALNEQCIRHRRRSSDIHAPSAISHGSSICNP